MATSGSVDYIATRNDLIEAAYRKIGVASRGETLSAGLTADAAEALEMLVKSWQAQGIHLWTYGDATLFLVAGQAQYALGSGGDHASESYVETTLDADEASGQTVLTVASISDLAASDNIGIELDDGTLQWTTISGAPIGTSVTIATALTGAASTGNTVYAYTTGINRPLRLQTVRSDVADNEIPMTRMARDTYFNQPNKTTTGIPTQFYYDPQLTLGQIYLWPAPQSVDYVVHFSYERSIEDFDAASNNPYFPVEWTRALVWNLASELAPEHGLSLERQAYIDAKAARTLVDVLDFDRERAPAQFEPRLR